MSKQHARSLLEKMYEQRESYIVGDDGATTWESVGVVFVAIVLGQSRSIKDLSELTGLPFLFLDAIIGVLEEDGWWFRIELADLVIATQGDTEKFAKISKAIGNVMEEFWATTDSQTLLVLEELRAGFLLGGQEQWWVDAENTLVPTRYTAGVN